MDHTDHDRPWFRRDHNKNLRSTHRDGISFLLGIYLILLRKYAKYKSLRQDTIADGKHRKEYKLYTSGSKFCTPCLGIKRYGTKDFVYEK